MTDQATTTAADAGSPQVNRSLTREALGILSASPAVWIAGAVLVLLLIISLAPHWFTSIDPRHCQLLMSRRPPSPGHWFGYDIQGCDVFARTIHGTRASLSVALLATLGSTLIGGLLGLIAGYVGGAVDAVISRLTDIVMGVPTLLGAIVILAMLGNSDGGGVLRLAFVLSVLGWASEARLMRACVLQTREAEYVRAARLSGAGEVWIVLRHVLPNSVTPLFVMATMSLGHYVAVEATLSYLGLGLQAPVISWGTSISDAQPYMASASHMLLYPSLFLTATVLTLVSLGEAMRNAFDPRSR